MNMELRTTDRNIVKYEVRMVLYNTPFVINDWYSA